MGWDPSVLTVMLNIYYIFILRNKDFYGTLFTSVWRFSKVDQSYWDLIPCRYYCWTSLLRSLVDIIEHFVDVVVFVWHNYSEVWELLYSIVGILFKHLIKTLHPSKPNILNTAVMHQESTLFFLLFCSLSNQHVAMICRLPSNPPPHH